VLLNKVTKYYNITTACLHQWADRPQIKDCHCW
jgi:hypothetical protein